MGIQEMEKTKCKTPLGTAQIWGNEIGLTKIMLVEDDYSEDLEIPEALRSAVMQLKLYFAGELENFDLKLNPVGTDFQIKVWQALIKIPFGQTTSYNKLSKNLGNIKAIRAVAAANGKNPLWIVIPCHRVIGSDGSLTGYAGGLWRKKWLIEHENPTTQLSLF